MYLDICPLFQNRYNDGLQNIRMTKKVQVFKIRQNVWFSISTPPPGRMAELIPFQNLCLTLIFRLFGNQTLSS